MSILFAIFLSMLKIGCFAFGGGYAIIALLENEFISKRNWIDHDEFLDVVAIAESTPGPIAINVATYIGYKLKGVVGAVLATVGMCLPAFLIMYIVSLFYEQFMQITLVAAAFKGIQICVVYLIASAGLKMLKKMKKDIYLQKLIELYFRLIIFQFFLYPLRLTKHVCNQQIFLPK